MKADSQNKRAAKETPSLSQDEIRRRAFELFEERGGQEGQELENWLRAESEIRNTKKDTTAA
jgi:hypothetical protein